MDFASDQLVNGTKFRALTIVDVFSHESLALVVDKSVRAKHVVDTLNRLRATRRRFTDARAYKSSTKTSAHFPQRR